MTKHTKKALISSVMALTLCFTMLVGTTFAWFTDTAANTGNRIVAGNLEVDLLMNDSSGYRSIADGAGDIFSQAAGGNGILWEPGKTEVVFLAVENKGSLALKYNIMLNVQDLGLAGALEYALIDGQQYIDLAGKSWAEISSGALTGNVAAGVITAAPNGKLAAGATDYFALAVHMKEAAGNEYQDKSVEVDVTVVATQATAESDSFGDQYDANAQFPAYTTPATFAERLAALNEGETMVLAAGVYRATANDQLRITKKNITIKGVGPATVIDAGDYTCAGAAGLIIAADNVTLSDLTIQANKGDALKVTELNNETNIIKNVTIRNVTLRSARGNSLNLHGVDGAVVDGVNAAQFTKLGVAMAKATNVTIKNSKTVAGGWGDVGVMFPNNGVETAAYNVASSFTFDASNTFANGLIYSERPATATGGADVVNHPAGWSKLSNANGSWTLVKFVEVANETELLAAMQGARSGMTVVVKQDIALASGFAVKSGVTLIGENGATISVNAGTTTPAASEGKIYLSQNAKLDQINFEITDNSNTVILAMDSGSSVTGCTFTGRFTLGDSAVNRAIVVNNHAAGVVISGNTFTNLRQPAYINMGVSGRVESNTVSGTKGFVTEYDSAVTFSGNSFTNNAVDICFIDCASSAADGYAGQAAAISAANNGAYVENQKSLEYAENGAACAKK